MGDGDGVNIGQLDPAWDAAEGAFCDAPTGSTTMPCPIAPMDASPKKPQPDCSFLNKQPNAKMPADGYDQLRKGKATFGKKSDLPNYKWPDGSSSPAATVQEVDIDGQKVKVYAPKNPSDKQPTTEQVAESLRALPPDQRGTVKEVVLSPNPGPDGASGEGGGGTAILYPTSGTPTQRNVDYRMTHEAGHSYQERVWKGADGMAAWDEAKTADGKSPSDYADINAGDDFCEFMNVYNVTKGTPCEASAKKLYPNRWKKMQEYQKP